MPKSKLVTTVNPGWRHIAEHLAAGRTIIGIDEVGRGAWAGPVVAGAVILRPRSRLAGVNDSKLLTANRRRELDGVIRTRALGWGIGWVEAAEVDARGLSWAIAESGRRAMAQLWTPDALVVLDGSWNYLRDTHEAITLVKADSRVLPVAAASIIAKVARDDYMAALDACYPGYGFASHVGYGTRAHQIAIEQLGPCAEHRCSYEPVGALRVDD